MHNQDSGISTYFKQIDLNSGPNAATSPLDERALFYFFRQPLDLTRRQTVKNMTTGRVLVSYGAGHRDGIGPDAELPMVNDVIDPGEEKEFHVGAHHILVWIDPSTQPASGVPAIVRVSAA